MPVGPLDKTFAPLLRLLGDKAGGGGGDTQLSLQTYLTRVTRVRLKLQQVSERTAAGLAFGTPADENPALGHGA
ncbi:hypothetical protein [Escherichia coli]|uniref:hypothetical protein n=1 Tax=Escherichia coli TaxID=562 RepID=UPI0013D5F06F|nr:hypothetical protein [Escherichia coli]ELL3259884.1 hypothetical protein [Escherichia coli]MDI0640131.1 hypothetical protein [Escherichia coli]MDI0909007.1 hypothetical protein [Escherichia coli]MDI0937154.1 hypothetical protein [Escherichia coli]MDI1216833.1 hypothetical protein [Escherichia coli]